jgi:DNA-binding XRE family transcriptional regulator
VTHDQCRQARALLGWDEWKLANRARISEQTVRNLEAGTRRSHAGTVAAVRAALEAAGVEFIAENEGGVGVRLREAVLPLRPSPSRSLFEPAKRLK